MIERNWQASWMWADDGRSVNAHLLFRRDFDLDEVPAHCCLHIAAETYAKVWLNGKLVHQTTSISYPSRHYYEETEIVDALQSGCNQISILGRYVGIPSGDSCPKDPGVIAEITVGDEVLLKTDDSWRMLQLDAWGKGKRRSCWFNLALMEECDFRKLPVDWPTPEITDEWQVPDCLPYPGVRISHLEKRPFANLAIASPQNLKLHSAGLVNDQSAPARADARSRPENFAIPALAVSAEEFQKVRQPAWLSMDKQDACPTFTISPPPAGQAVTLIYELNGYDRGYPEIKAQGEAGAVVDLSWHEYLLDGHCDFRKSKVYTTDRFILQDGLNVIRPWEWYCGRYLQLTFRNFSKELKIKRFSWCPANYPLAEQVKFSSSNAKLARIWEICRNSVRLCMQDNIMDCPWRERRQWIGDAHRIGLINHYLFGDRDLLRGVLRQHVQLQDPSGRMWVCLPLFEEYPLQSMAWLRAVLDYDFYTGDQSLLDEVGENAISLHHWFNRNRDEHDLLFITQAPSLNWQDNTFKELMKYQHKTPFLVMNLCFLLFLEDIAQVYSRKGKDSEADAIKAEKEQLTAKFADLFRDEKTGLLRDMLNPEYPVSFSEAGHALAVLAGIPGAVELWDNFCEFRKSHPDRTINTSPFGKFWTLEALGKMGREEDIIAEIINGWGPMVDADSDTAWEAFADPGFTSASGHSLCHGWAGVPIVALMRYIFKVEPGQGLQERKEHVVGIEWMALNG